jgi:hypothetical protein
MRLARTDYGRPREGNDGFQLGESSDQRPARETGRTAGWSDELERVADGRGIELPQSLKVG